MKTSALRTIPSLAHLGQIEHSELWQFLEQPQQPGQANDLAHLWAQAQSEVAAEIAPRPWWKPQWLLDIAR